MKKILISILLLILCVNLYSFSFASGYESEFNVMSNTQFMFDKLEMTEEEINIYKQALRQYDAIIFYDKLINAFIEHYGEENGEPSYYPENYAGSYINDDGKLVIQITNINDSKVSNVEFFNDYSKYVDLKKIKEEDAEFKAEDIKDVVVFESAEYSLNELNNMLKDTINKINEKFTLSGYYVDTFNNTVNVMFEPVIYEKAVNDIDNYNSKSIDDKKIPLVFEISVTTEPDAHHIGGQGYYYHGAGGGITLGFTGWYNGQKAYLSCGHSSKYITGDTAKYENTIVGTVANKQWANNGSGDWSIVYLNSGETISGLIKQNSSGTVTGKIKARVNNVTKNTIVYRFGNKTLGWASLQVDNSNVSKGWNDVGTNTTYTINGQVRCIHKTGPEADSGDSGGPYVIPNGSDWSAVGTHTGKSNDGYTYFSPMNHVPSNFTVEIGY